MKLFTRPGISLLVLFILSCNADDNGADNPQRTNCYDFATDPAVQTAIDTYINAATTYGQDPTNENCNNLKISLDNYFEVIDGYVDNCYNEEDFQEWRDSIEQWRAERDQLDC